MVKDGSWLFGDKDLEFDELGIMGQGREVLQKMVSLNCGPSELVNCKTSYQLICRFVYV